MRPTRPVCRPGTWHVLLLAYGVGAAVSALHAARHDGLAVSTQGLLAQWFRDSTLALPAAALAVVLATRGTRGLLRWSGQSHDGGVPALLRAAQAATAFALLLVPVTAAGWVLFPPPAAGGAGVAGAHGHGVQPAADAVAAGLGTTAATHAATGFLVGLALLLVAPHLGRVSAAVTRGLARPRTRRSILASATVPTVVSGLLAVPVTGATVVAGAHAADPGCDASTAVRSYDVAAINVHLVYNRWGQGNPDGQVYVLQHDKQAVRDWHKPLDPASSSNRRLRPRPLVLRANEGECVAVRFTNELDAEQGEGLPANPRASMYVRGVPFDVQSSSGSHVGYNDDTTVGRGETVTYYWQAGDEGIHFFNDTATPAGGEADGGSLAAGLYGAFVVEPAGSAWADPVSGDPLYTGTLDQSGELYIDAVITPPDGESFRESIQLAQDELPHTSTFAFNYGSEDTSVRQEHRCADCVGEETSLSSWVYGDPSLVKLASGFGPWLPHTPEGSEDCGLGTEGFDADSCFTANVTHAYKGDPLKIRYGMAGVKETHVFHLHAHTWLAEDQDSGAAGNPARPSSTTMPESSTIDSQTFGPMEMFTADLLYGAGSRNGTVGDSIFHCHLYPHFVAGFWSLLRVHDVAEDGTGTTPDGIRVAALEPLTGFTPPEQPTADNPGFPRFIPGTFGWRAPQPPLGITRNGVPEPRMVAGQVLTPGPALALEEAVMDRMSGGDPQPGSPFNDPCPAGSREVTYNVSAIQVRTVYNERGDFDSQTRLLVLDKDVEAILSGRKAPEPLFVRVNAGDCVTWNLTNRLPNWFGGDAFQLLTQTNMFGQHIHLVKFDVLASDGASNGWNYQQAAFSRAQSTFNENIATDPDSCTQASCRLDDPADGWDPFTTSEGLEPGQTITERWFADYEVRTAFTHDHHFAAIDQNRGQYGALVVEPSGVDFRNPVTGTYYQPINDAAHGTPCLTACTGTAAGTSMDVIGSGPDDDFREFGLAIADFVPLTRGGGDPRDPADAINPPTAPEVFPDEDPGVMAVNYRNAPLELRRTKNGQPVDPAYMFSSHVFGDPMTPVLQTYNGDNVRIRMIQGSQEEQHTMMIHGVKWKREPDDPDSPYVDAQPVGLSEAFSFEVPRFGCAAGQDCRGDYLYTSSSVDDMWSGMWGLMRVNGGSVPDLLPLPDNPQHRSVSVPSPSPTAMAPPARTTPGNPCPVGAPQRTFDVVALQTDIVYNAAGDHDPYGLVYALAQDEAAIRAGRNPEPLVLRVNEGDCVEVTLTNKLTADLQQHRGEGDARLPGGSDAPRVPGLRVSLHASLLKYDVRGSDGAAVGYNADQTVAPGQAMTYRWFADEVTARELGAVNLTDYGDPLGHRHHGLFAGLVVEPATATWHDQVTGAPLASGGAADVRVPGADDFRESVVFFQDGLNLRTADGSLVEDPVAHAPTAEEPGEDTVDPEDSGEKAFSYRSEPFRNRLGYEPVVLAAADGEEQAHVYDSHRHGDPATPTFRAYTGDPLRMRVLLGNDKPRQHAFGVAGHAFPTSPGDPGSRSVGTQSGLGPGMAVNADLGPASASGDYLYGCDVGFFHRSGGLWGMLRVYPAPAGPDALMPTPLAAVDDPRAGGHPLLPLELDQVVVHAFDDTDQDGRRDAGEAPLAKATVTLTSAEHRTVAVADTDGVAYLSVPAGSYAVSVQPAGSTGEPVATGTVTTGGDNDVQRIDAGAGGVSPTAPAGSTGSTGSTGGSTEAPGSPGSPDGATGTPAPAPATGSTGGTSGDTPGDTPGDMTGDITGTIEVTAYADADGDGARDATEAVLAGVDVLALSDGVVAAADVTDGSGTGRLTVAPGSYAVTAAAPEGYQLLRPPGPTVVPASGGTTAVAVPLVPVADVDARSTRLRVRVVLDRDRDGRADRGEPTVRGTRILAYRRTALVGRTVTDTRGVGVLVLQGQRRHVLSVTPPRRLQPLRRVVVRTSPPGTVQRIVVLVIRR